MIKFIKENKFLILVFLLSLLSVFLGAFLVKISDEKTLSLLSSLTGGHLQKSSEGNVGQTVFYSIGADMLFLFIVFLLGFSPISIPFISLTVMFSALGIGVSVGYMYLSFSSSALLYVAVLIAPSCCLSLLGLCFAANDAMNMSALFFVRCFKENASRIKSQKIYKYSLNFVGFSCIIILSGILDTALNRIFLNVITL